MEFQILSFIKIRAIKIVARPVHSQPNPIKQPLFLVEIVNQGKKRLRLQVGSRMQNQHLLKGDGGEVPY